MSGADKSERSPNRQQYLFGDWNGERSSLLERGVKFDLFYTSDTLGNVSGANKTRLAMWNRVRGTIDLDFSRLTQTPGLTLHITGLWQGGDNLGKYLGVFAGPSGLVSENTFRLDSWWVEKRIYSDRFIVRVGQFAAQDFYGAQQFGSSYVFEPFQYALANLGATYESFDPPSTPAAELRVIPIPHFYVKSMVFAADRNPYAHNPTGFVPQFRGPAMSVSEIGYTPGNNASPVRVQDNLETRKGYQGLYQFGAAYNPGKFRSTLSAVPVPGNYLIYGYANQALYRTARDSARGVDFSTGVDWTPSDKTRNNQDFNIGLRFNEPFSIPLHNTIGIAYVRSGINRAFPVDPPLFSTHSAEHALEINTLFGLPHGILLQPVVQFFANSGGSSRDALVLGLHIKVNL